MEEHLNTNEEFLFDLLESKDYSELSPAERERVKALITEDDYSERRAMIKDAADVFDDEIILPPLRITPVKTIPFYRRPVPLYQVMMAAAAVVLIFLLVPTGDLPGSEKVKEIIVQHDTVEVEKLVCDTVVRIEERKVIVEKPVYLRGEDEAMNTKGQPQSFEAGPRFELPPIEKSTLDNSGTSLREESSAVLIKDYLR